jgi:2-keto-myo-inositol isomerase
MSSLLPRREMLARSGCALGAMSLGGPLLAAEAAKAAPARQPASFSYCLNTSTIRGQGLSLVEEIQIAAKAGYQAVEPWTREIDQYVATGGSLKDLGKRLRDLGLAVPSAIGFAEWIVDDDARRAKGLLEAQRTMDMLAQIGGTRLAAPPVGGTKQHMSDLAAIAQRYRALLELGDKMNVVPEVEVWGHSQTLNRLGEAVYVAIESGHPQACLLPDIYHLFRGGSDFNGLKLLSGSAIHVFHVNDYPASPPRQEMNDAMRVYPGDGVAPLATIFQDLRANGFQGYLSLELFNRDYYAQDAFTVARTGLEKTRAAVERSLA